MRSRIWAGISVSLFFAVAILTGCAATLKSYDQISLGMTPEEVMKIAGAPHRILLVESTGEGTLLPTPAGKHEVWIYRGGVIQFSEGKVVAKGQRVNP
ncbi:MAG: hypothetical protein QHH30_04350 [candidate division NC10 bacterium]|nr:hypothetical protein [candidate division NC10 bacterium]